MEFPRSLFSDETRPDPSNYINYSSTFKTVKAVKDVVSAEVWEHVENSPLGVIIKYMNLKFAWSSILVHYILSRQLYCKKLHELWFSIEEQPVRFTLFEFEDITSLKCEPLPNAIVVEDVEKSNHFRAMFNLRHPRSIPSAEDILQLCRSPDVCRSWSREDQIRLYYLAILTGGLLGLDRRDAIPPAKSKPLMDLEIFEQYPWGRVAFVELVHQIKTAAESGRIKNGSYVCKGFVQVIQELDVPLALYKQRYKEWLGDQSKIPKGSYDYYIGKRPTIIPPGKQWGRDVDTLYSVLLVGKCHWVLMAISIRYRTIKIYDSSTDVISKETIKEAAMPFAHMLPYVLYVFSDAEVKKVMDAAMYSIQFVTDGVPQSKPPYGDCGIYAVKFLECLVMGVPFADEHLLDSNMMIMRRKLAAEMYDETRQVFEDIQEQPVRFTLFEFEDITGLKCEPLPNAIVVEDVEKSNRFRALFKLRHPRSIPSAEDILQLCRSPDVCRSWSREDQIRLCYLAILTGGLLGLDRREAIPLAKSKLLMDLEIFEQYPWGRVAFIELVAAESGRIKNGSYVCKGFVQVIQVWAYAYIPCIREAIGRPIRSNGICLLRFKGKGGKLPLSDIFKTA
ncbi:hypothetical protein Bca4012_026366 [Brassica carinata]